MAVCKNSLLESFKEDTLTSWAKYLKMDIRTIQKLLDGTGTIHIKTAQKIVDRINEQTGNKFDLDIFFNVEELKGYEKKREVIIEWKEQMTDEDWISMVRYVFERKFEAFALKDVFYFCFSLGLILLIITLIIR